MKRRRQDILLPVSLGFADGILNALTLASGSLVGRGAPVTVGLAARISIAAMITASFAVFVAEYAQARGGLRYAAWQLSMPPEADLASTQLGRHAILRTVERCGLAGCASLLGAFLPLAIAAALPGPGWIAALVAIAALGILGTGLAREVHGGQLRWALTLMIGGVAVTAIGVWLNIA